MASFALNEHYEKFIKKQLDSGRYNNASEVVRAGLRLLEDQEDARERWLNQEIPGRYAELKRDPSKGIPLDEAFARLEAEHQALAKAK
ncbi:type II toxin-antitoxin system ParD family antitoxin [Ensifer sp. T173]|uniref:Type II toxin-antitoxin system ParD family antitoxin n=1 Tax=Ensifer canadensis TaxID=555315 RepID=A0AAW4FUR5_9HYPH|nr:type II toxin-antitoxin system ParD family antitoxin [Ensifer canadensis]MBM3095071.1 type II toxin-antitoxin system ParD family antitoxin [Ensifer canadensis]UBI80646.1 type II toxin-antitoxin system ParD family antitoxin [Ensifer canadensis]